MITKEEFINLITEQIEWCDKIDEISETLNAPSLYECSWIEYASTLFDKILDFYFKEEGIDHINWWLYEKNRDPKLKMWYVHGKEIPTDTVEDLWNLVKEYRK